MKQRKRGKFGLTVLDLILAVLVVAAVLSTVFYDQIHAFLEEEELVTVSYTFRVQSVTDTANNEPSRGEELREQESRASLGTLTDKDRKESEYVNKDNENDVKVLSSLICKAQVDAVVNENGEYLVSGFKIKPGEEYTVITDTASFRMKITKVELVDN